MGGECCHPQRFRQPADAAGPCTRTQMVTMLNRLLGRVSGSAPTETAFSIRKRLPPGNRWELFPGSRRPARITVHP